MSKEVRTYFTELSNGNFIVTRHSDDTESYKRTDYTEEEYYKLQVKDKLINEIIEIVEKEKEYGLSDGFGSMSVISKDELLTKLKAKREEQNERTR